MTATSTLTTRLQAAGDAHFAMIDLAAARLLAIALAMAKANECARVRFETTQAAFGIEPTGSVEGDTSRLLALGRFNDRVLLRIHTMFQAIWREHADKLSAAVVDIDVVNATIRVALDEVAHILNGTFVDHVMKESH